MSMGYGAEVLVFRRALRFGLVAWCVCAGGLACGPEVVRPDHSVVAAEAEDCSVVQESVKETLIGAKASFDNTLIQLGGEAHSKDFEQVKPRLDALQNDYQLLSRRACQDYKQGSLSALDYQRLRQCHDRAFVTMRTIQLTLDTARGEVDGRELAWILESKLGSLEDALRCEAAPAAAASAPQGGLHLAAVSGGAPASSALQLEAELICQRRRDSGGFEVVEGCDQAQLKEGDRFQVRLKSPQPAYFYLFLYNSSGQFQMLFPDAGVPNQLGAGVGYALPAAEDFWELDGSGGVLEKLQLVVSAAPVLELEQLRGADIPPAAGGGLAASAAQTRGKIEPLVTRGVKKGGKVALLRADGQLAPGDLPLRGEGILAREFTIQHVY